MNAFSQYLVRQLARARSKAIVVVVVVALVIGQVACTGNANECSTTTGDCDAAITLTIV
ncbi:MAG: hypothetical protein L0332_17760 [Chloroflexi bacterium]|nr:hypothetical protein [Chloroflexota bacterium]MCI0728548.1 hypothetical protein [Chloroflexota bacterium]